MPRAPSKAPGTKGKATGFPFPAVARLARFFGLFPRKQLYHQANDKQMERIVQVKQPLHDTVAPHAPAAASVVQMQKRYGKQNPELKQAVDHIHGNAIHQHIKRHEKQAPAKLFFRLASIGAYRKNAKRSNAAPIAGERNDAHKRRQQALGKRRQALGGVNAKQNQAAEQRPDHAGLIQKTAVIKRNEAERIHILIGAENIRKVRNYRHHGQPRRVFVDIAGVVKALRNKITHDRAGNPADQMQQQRKRLPRITGKQRPRQMIRRHGQNGDQLERVGVQAGLGAADRRQQVGGRGRFLADSVCIFCFFAGWLVFPTCFLHGSGSLPMELHRFWL